MISLELTDTKQLMSHLLSKDVFDRYLIREVLITTFCTMRFDGAFRRDFYSAEEMEEMKSAEEFVRWDRLKTFCFQFVKGKRLPLKMQLTFLLPPEEVRRLMSDVSFSDDITAENVNSLSFTILYEQSRSSVRSGLSLNIFTLDKSFEHAWDHEVAKIFEAYR
ncbi:MAG: DUF5721 family protein [Lachnospiraceae bacterium]|nr:DUF5721 family protein [Lachnospiraceae bacterium]